MKTYCLVCKKDTENKYEKVIKTKNCRLMLLPKCSICRNKKTRFVTEEEGYGLLSLSKIPGLNIWFSITLNQ